MTIDLSQFIQVFFDETAEHLDSMESLLLQLDVAAPDAEDLNAIFRAAHSIKGGAATFGFADLTDVTHILENQLDRVRKGTLSLRADMVDTFLEAGDTLSSMLHTHQSGEEPDLAVARHICARLQALEPPPGQRYGLQLQPDGAAMLGEIIHGLHAMGWQEDAGQPGQFYGVFAQSASELNEGLAFLLPASAYQLQAPAGATARNDGFGLFAPLPAANVGRVDVREEDDGFGLFAPLPDAGAGNPDVLEEDDGFGLFAPLPAAGAGNPDVLEEDDGFGLFAPLPAASADVLEEDNGFGLFAPLPPAAAPAGPVPGAAAVLAPAKAAPAKAREAVAHADNSSIRVSVEKVDQIINMVGELVITQAMLAQVSAQFDPAIHERLHAGIAMLERNTRQLQESAMSIRMMPISSVFSRFPRVVRDTAAKLNKKVRLVTHGEHTELDRGLIERLADPLTHLVRNSLDHGIEQPAQRLARGKDEQGTLTLKAFHQGGNIIIQVLDDGAGLNRERILAKARAQGMNLSDSISDAELWPLIFDAGFSTAETVTDVSGRGVGMDVVRRNIQGMGGRIDIDTVPDVGTTMTIRLPLTLAILDGMAVSVLGEVYVIPLAFIVESLQPRSEDIKSISGRGQVLYVRGEYLPVITLREVFGHYRDTTLLSRGLFVILESESGKAALLVDDLLGQSQVVIKSLETNYRKVPGVSGATIMGDGRVALIIDVESLVRLSQKHISSSDEPAADGQ